VNTQHRRLWGAALAGAMLVCASSARAQPAPTWPWLDSPHGKDTLEDRIAAPEGFTRVAVKQGSFAAFLRRLPLLPAGADVRAFDGRVLNTAHVAVVDLDVGTVDLQQCADSAIRLRAEYLWSRDEKSRIAFHTTSGDRVPYARYQRGEEIAVRGNTVGWRKSTRAQGGPNDRSAFRRYLHDVFMYAGSISLARDTEPVKGEVQAGDMYVVGGSPGHVLVVLDVALHGDERRLLLGEGFMPAQSFHVVPAVDGSTWVTPGADGAISVPTWPAPFARASLRRFTRAAGP
jgi:Domain of unknown function (4846)